MFLKVIGLHYLVKK